MLTCSQTVWYCSNLRISAVHRLAMHKKMKKWFDLGSFNWRRLSTILIIPTIVVILIIAFSVFFAQKRGKSISVIIFALSTGMYSRINLNVSHLNWHFLTVYRLSCHRHWQDLFQPWQFLSTDRMIFTYYWNGFCMLLSKSYLGTLTLTQNVNAAQSCNSYFNI